MPNIALLGGGTAGHIMPNVALLPNLKELFDRVIYIGSENSMEEEISKSKDIPYFTTKTIKFHRNRVWKNAAIPITVARGIAEAKKILKHEKIDVVFSKGGYAAVPTVFAARILGIPIVCHESDRTMGLANRLTARLSERVYTAFPGTYRRAEIIATPIREEIFEGKTFSPFLDKSRKTLLFMGGSLGAEAINDALSKCYSILSDKYNILHITGKHGLPLRAPSYYAVPFTKSIADFFASADLVVTRAGASTLGELTALGKRIVAIPLPKGESRGDQEENAAYYLEKNLVSVLPQSCLGGDRLVSAIEQCIMKRPPAPAYDKNTTKRLAEELYRIAERKRPR